MTSPGSVTSRAPPDFRSSCVPREVGLSTRPGTANTSRPCSSAASLAVINAPEPTAASMTRTPSEIPEMIRFLGGKFSGAGALSMGSSETIDPPSPITRSNSSAFSGGYVWPRPHPSTTIVRPEERTAPRCPAVSIPRAPPETTVNPARAKMPPNRSACSSPYGEQCREPTIATGNRSSASGDRPPRT